MRTLAVVTAGLSTPSSTRQLADAISGAVASETANRGEHLDTTVIEVRELAGELADAMTNWATPTPHLDAAKEAVVGADALVAVTPVFQGSYSGLFKTFFDTFGQHSLEELPTLVGATGGSARHALILDYALRPLFNYLHAVVVPTGVFQATEDLGTAEGSRVKQRIQRAARQLTDYIVSPRDHVEGLAGPRGVDPRGGDPRSANARGGEQESLTGPTRADSPSSFAELLRQHDGTAD